MGLGFGEGSYDFLMAEKEKLNEFSTLGATSASVPHNLCLCAILSYFPISILFMLKGMFFFLVGMFIGILSGIPPYKDFWE